MKKNPLFCCGVAVLLAAVLAALVVTFAIGLGLITYRSTPRLVSAFQQQEPAPDRYHYSQEQTDWLNRIGNPDGFYLLFFQREDTNGLVEEVRYEEWFYYGEGLVLTFENGQLITQKAVESEDVTPARFTPDLFTAYLSRGQIASLTGLEEWLIVPVEGVLVSDAQQYYAQGLAFGLQDGELIYVETLLQEVAQ